MQKHPIFRKYTREYLSERTGYTRSYLSHISTGKMRLTPTFVKRVSAILGEPAESLFVLDDLTVSAGQVESIS